MAGAERIELSPKVLETPVLPLILSPYLKKKKRSSSLFFKDLAINLKRAKEKRKECME